MELEERAADPLAGGLMRGYQCGMVWGSALAAGAQIYRTLGTGPAAEAQAIIAAQRIAESFRRQNKSINCREITGIDLLAPKARSIIWYLVKSAPRGSCLGMSARCAHMSAREINAILLENPVEAPPAPVSCAAMLAQKMGASDLHTVMAAGLAGGIGLSGAACGALGAAVWLISMEDGEKPEFEITNPRVSALLKRFGESTGGEFECSKIAGRKFESIRDHAGYLQAGGCSKLIGSLAAWSAA